MIHDNAPARRPSRPPRDLAFAHRQADGLAQLFQVAVATAPTAAVPVIRDLPAPAPARRPRPRRQLRLRPLTRGPWPLILILAAQAALSLRLVWATGAYGDEGLYLWAGHLEWAHWLYNSPTPDFGAYFSGAPVVYPPLAALADTVGGLIAARLLSLAMILGATVLLYRVGARLFGTTSGLCGAMMYAGASAPQFLGAFATYDAMAIFMLALATWLAVEASLRRHLATRIVVLVLSAAALVTADGAKYVAILFDPVVVAVAAGSFWSASRRMRAGIAAGTGYLAILGGVCAAVLSVVPGSYFTGLVFTTTGRQGGSFPVQDILIVAAGWSGIIALLAILGLVPVLANWKDGGTRLTAAAFAGAPLLVPAAAARGHLFVSMFKHVGYGEWFGAALAGYALASLMHTVPPDKYRKAARLAMAMSGAAAVLGFLLAGNQYLNMGPDFRRALPLLHQVAAVDRHAVVAADDPDTAQYYAAQIPGMRVVAVPQRAAAASRQILRYGGKTGDPAFPEAVKHGYFAAAVLSGFHLWALGDDSLRKELHASGLYRLALSPRYHIEGRTLDYQVWVRK